MDSIIIAALVGWALASSLLIVWLRARSRAETAIQQTGALQERFAPALSIDEEIARLRTEAKEARKETEEVRRTYREKRELLDKLRQQVAVYDERLSFAELGVYEPHFDFGDSESYKQKIKEARERQRRLIRAKQATVCPTDWTVEGSRAKGRVMTNRQTRLTMRAFNTECEAAIANTRWNNVKAMERRILNAEKQINAANASMQLFISGDYVALKLDELRLTHEYREQVKIEKDERRERVRAEREEKKLLQQAKAAEREERKYQALLERARKEAGVDEGRIAELEAALADAHADVERARAMAQRTKSGYVYIISNIGSFGEDVVKIGVTRRLNPDDRVRELGDASVPFRFDTHAMIYSEDAPSLESALHRAFSEHRVNQANMRKEFFAVTLEDVEEAVKRLSPDASFFKDREAQEWHETLARRKQMLTAVQAEDEFPAEI